MTACARCEVELDGYGVIYGMVCTDLDEDGAERGLIVCYVNGCRDLVLDGMVNYTGAGECSTCGTATARALSHAMLASDLDENGFGRPLIFCYDQGHRDAILGTIWS
jgi:hypothetical protein